MGVIMKRNLECITEVLLYLEKRLVVRFDINLPALYEIEKLAPEAIVNAVELKTYNEEDVCYSLQKLAEDNYIVVKLRDELTVEYVLDITSSGHDKLVKIHEAIEANSK